MSLDMASRWKKRTWCEGPGMLEERLERVRILVAGFGGWALAGAFVAQDTLQTHLLKLTSNIPKARW